MQLVIPAGAPAHELRGVSVSVVEVPMNAPTAAGHPSTKFVTLSEPRPVARSKPVPVTKPSTPVGLPLEFTVSSTPTDVELTVVLLQLNVAARHGSELFPFTTSLKTQVDAGPSEELQT